MMSTIILIFRWLVSSLVLRKANTFGVQLYSAVDLRYAGGLTSLTTASEGVCGHHLIDLATVVFSV